MRSKSLFKRVFDFARAELERRARGAEGVARPAGVEREWSSRPAQAARECAAPAREHAVHGLQVSHAERGGLKLAWSISDEQLARARALIDPEAVLCVRVVSYSPLRDDVLREVQDRPGVDAEGSCEVGALSGRGLVSVGLRAGERFVSIVHHVL